MAIKAFDAERATPGTIICCAKCEHPRGTFASLQVLALSGVRGQFEI